MNIMKTHKHISGDTGISKIKEYSWGGEECNYKGSAPGSSFGVMEQFCTLAVWYTNYA